MYQLLLQFLDTDDTTVLEYQNIVCLNDIQTVQTLAAMTQLIVDMYRLQPDVTIYIYNGIFSELLEDELYLHVVNQEQILLLCVSVIHYHTGGYLSSGDALAQLGTRDYTLPLQ